MRANQHILNRFFFKTFGALTLLAVIGLTSDCHAQLRRGRLMRASRFQAQERDQEFRAAPNRPIEAESSPRLFQNTTTRFFDPRNSRSFDPGSGDPRYIGGFHYTHFQNIGIPSGDIGLRGNAYHWRPW